MSDASTSRYRFGPLERRGFLAGWKGGQVAIVAAGLVLAVGALRVLPTVAALLVAVFAVGVSLAAATWPSRVAQVTSGSLMWHGTRRPSSKAVVGGHRGSRQAGGQLHPRTRERTGRRGGPFSSLRILQVEPGRDDVKLRAHDPSGGRPRSPGALAAVVYDPRERTYTSVMPASGPGFVLLGGAERDRRVSGWAAALGALARQGTPVSRIQWVDAPCPVWGPLERRARRRGRALRVGASYDELMAAASPHLGRHQVLLAMSVKSQRAGLALRAPGAQEHADSCTLLLRELAAFRRRLSDADVDTAPALAPRALASVIRAGYSTSRWASPEECGTTWPWPVAGEVLWTS